jgi:hypothetical protein
MEIPRSGGSGLHWRKHILGYILALVALLGGTPCLAQNTGVLPDTAADSAVAKAADGAVRDTTVRDTTIRDTTVRDPSAAGDTTNLPARPAPPPAPADSALTAACKESAGDPPDLLIVTFRSSATADARAAVAREVGGTLVGTSEHAAPGAWYLRVPGSAGDPTVADRLILFAPVLEVGTTRCPS